MNCSSVHTSLLTNEITVPTIIVHGSLYSGWVAFGDFDYLLIHSWSSSGVTLSLFLTNGSVVLYASDRIQSPSTVGGYDWRIQSSDYTETFLDPSTLGRQAGDSVSIALQGSVWPVSHFVIQIDSGNTLTTGRCK